MSKWGFYRFVIDGVSGKCKIYSILLMSAFSQNKFTDQNHKKITTVLLSNSSNIYYFGKNYPNIRFSMAYIKTKRKQNVPSKNLGVNV